MSILRPVLIACALFVASTANAEIKTETFAYHEGDTACKGFLAYDTAAKGKRPAVLIVHEWWGLGDFVKESATKLAEAGYVALAVDMYGDGKLLETPEEAGAMAGSFKKDPAKSRARFEAALTALKARPEVNAKRIGAMGYCFGGTMVLDMARQGVALKGVVSFHGGLSTAVTAPVHPIKAKVLVLHGAIDPFVPEAEVEAFKTEMANAKAKLEFVAYPDAVHSFTNPAVDARGMDGAKYNAAAAKSSWESMLAFFKKAL